MTRIIFIGSYWLQLLTYHPNRYFSNVHNHFLSLLVIFQVSKSSSDFWNNLKLTWQQCADLPFKCWASSVAELDGNVYIAMDSGKGAYVNPLMYDSKRDQWSTLPALPYCRLSLVIVPGWKQLLAIGGVVKNNGVDEVNHQ